MECISAPCTPTIDAEFDHQASFDEHLPKSQRKTIQYNTLQHNPKHKKSNRLAGYAKTCLEMMQALSQRLEAPDLFEDKPTILAEVKTHESKIQALEKIVGKGLAKAKHQLAKAKSNVQIQSDRLDKVSKETFRKNKPWKIAAKNARVDEDFSKGKVKRQERLAARAQKLIKETQIGLENAKTKESLAKSQVKIASLTYASISKTLDLAKKINELAHATQIVEKSKK